MSELFLRANKNKFPLVISGLQNAANALYIADALKDIKARGIIIMPDLSYARRIAQEMSMFTERELVLFPDRDYLFYNYEASNQINSYKRLDAICRLTQNKDIIIVTTIKAISQYTLPKDAFESMVFRVGCDTNFDSISKKLVEMNYTNSFLTQGVGQFSVRGGIIDVYPPNEQNPVRIEFFGDTVDTIRIFDPETQLSVENVEHIAITPARETPFDEVRCKNAAAKLNDIRDKLNLIEHKYFYSCDKYLPLLHEKFDTLLNYLSSDDVVFLVDSERCKEKSKNYTQHTAETITRLIETGELPYNLGEYYLNYDAIEKTVNVFSEPIEKDKSAIMQKSVDVDDYIEICKSHLPLGYKIAIVTDSKQRCADVIDALKMHDIPSKYSDKIVFDKITVSLGLHADSFILPKEKIIFISLATQAQKQKQSTKKTKPLTFSELSIGDYVVHTIHGIGKYLGTQKMVIDDITKEYLKIEYANGDMLYVPISSLDLVNKYTGSDSEHVKLNKMGGEDFKRVKAKVSKNAEELAKKLIELYAKRKMQTGYAFPSDNDWQMQLEANFPYEETTDQLQAIQEVKHDMQSDRPMERLLCGDVGFGKTEVALRGAFKCVLAGKQVAYLVPTTVLAYQHYNTFSSRMSEFPLKVALLCRFCTPKEIKKTIKGIKDGTIDIVIGTHRLLQKDVVFKDLGMLIIDEEQRFGALDKEKIKELKTNIDVLTLTATPIPRTLHMAMIGLRDMSTISKPPMQRHPVATFVCEYNFGVITEAIEFELARGGQVYYVHNKIDSIYTVAHKLKEQFPSKEIAVGHGRMNERELENVMFDVANGHTDIFVCTTIIETGLDVPNMNTIIVEDADKFGLATLYQLRGRVGRSDRVAYAYLTYKPEKSINETAIKRLKAIREFTELGSGFKIAMKDLEIRGAGNILGDKQHGAMEAVGYDLYLKLLGDEIKRQKGEEVKEDINVVIDFNINAYIPENFIPQHDVRIDLYKKIADVATEQDKQDVFDEIIDRQGTVVKEIENLIEIAIIRHMCIELKISELTQRGSKVYLRKFDRDIITDDAVYNLIKICDQHIMFKNRGEYFISYDIQNASDKEILLNVKSMLQILKEFYNNANSVV